MCGLNGLVGEFIGVLPSAALVLCCSEPVLRKPVCYIQKTLLNYQIYVMGDTEGAQFTAAQVEQMSKTMLSGITLQVLPSLVKELTE